MFAGDVDNFRVADDLGAKGKRCAILGGLSEAATSLSNSKGSASSCSRDYVLAIMPRTAIDLPEATSM